MKRVVLFVLFLIGRISLNAQVFDQSVINTLQRCIQQKQYERADSIINSFRNTDLPETSVFWLNLIHSDIGVSKYRQSRDPQVILPKKMHQRLLIYGPSCSIGVICSVN